MAHVCQEFSLEPVGLFCPELCVGQGKILAMFTPFALTDVDNEENGDHQHCEAKESKPYRLNPRRGNFKMKRSRYLTPRARARARFDLEIVSPSGKVEEIQSVVGGFGPQADSVGEAVSVEKFGFS